MKETNGDLFINKSIERLIKIRHFSLDFFIKEGKKILKEEFDLYHERENWKDFQK